MPGARAAALDQQALAGGDEHCVAPLLEAAEQRRDRHAERLRQPLQRRERCRRDAVLDLRQHAERQVGGAREIGGGDAELVAEGAHLAADGDLEHVVARALQRVRILFAGKQCLACRDVAGDAARARLACRLRAGYRPRSRVIGALGETRFGRALFAGLGFFHPPSSFCNASNPTMRPPNSSAASRRQSQKYTAAALSASKWKTGVVPISARVRMADILAIEVCAMDKVGELVEPQIDGAQLGEHVRSALARPAANQAWLSRRSSG